MAYGSASLLKAAADGIRPAKYVPAYRRKLTGGLCNAVALLSRLDNQYRSCKPARTVSVRPLPAGWQAYNQISGCMPGVADAVLPMAA